MIPHDWTDLRELEISLGGGERLPGLMWVFLESSQPDGSGGGYKRPLLLERPDWVTLHLSRDDFEPQGAPAGWSSIQSIRIVGGEWGLDAVAGATLYVDRVVLHRGDEPQPTTPAAPPLVANALGHRQWAVTQPPGPDDEPAGALFVTALCVTGDDEVWVGSEEGGLAQFQGGKLRRHLTKAAGLLDSYVYALAADSQGALYIGQGRSGLLKLVAGGETALPVAGTQIGRHVYDVEIDASDRKWVASERGITVLSPADELLARFNDRHGLPCSPVLDVALAPDGAVWAVPACGGLARYAPGDGWRVVAWPDGPPLLNRVVVDSQGRVWAGGAGGLVHLAGIDRQPLMFARPPTPPDEAPAVDLGRPVAPDTYITALALVSEGLYVGTRHEGLFRITTGADQANWQPLPVAPQPGAGETYVRCLAATGDRVLVGTFGDGLYELQRPEPVAPGPRPDCAAAMPGEPPLDQSRADLVARFPDPATEAWAQYVGEDWVTRGDWVGNYGNTFAVLCGMYSPYSGFVTTNLNPLSSRYMDKRGIQYYIGSSAAPGDVLRAWVHWLQTDDPRVLLDPQAPDSRNRRQGEWDDHGEAYGRAHAGPHVYFDLALPAGRRVPARFLVSLYFFNKDGHTTDNRYRDYDIKVIATGGPVGSLRQAGNIEAAFDARPLLARARVVDHRGGCYQRFVLNGGHTYTFSVRNNGSHNVNVSGVFVDDLDDNFAISYNDLHRAQEHDDTCRVRVGL
jgi:hypothetical protein